MEIVVKILADILAAFYQTAGASLLLAALVMCVYMLGRKQGAGPVVRGMDPEFPDKCLVQTAFLPGILCWNDVVSDNFVPEHLGKSARSCAWYLGIIQTEIFIQRILRILFSFCLLWFCCSGQEKRKSISKKKVFRMC